MRGGRRNGEIQGVGASGESTGLSWGVRRAGQVRSDEGDGLGQVLGCIRAEGGAGPRRDWGRVSGWADGSGEGAGPETGRG